MDKSTQPLLDAIAKLNSQREHAGNSTRMLEAIIAHCSNIVRQAPGLAMRAAAARIRTTAMSLYSSPKSNHSTTMRFLEEAIEGLNQELKSERELKWRSPLGRV